MVSVILINYYSADLLKDCLDSFYHDSSLQIGEIIVCDNSAVNGDSERILQSFPRVKWMYTGGNIGFARANNLGIKQATGDAFLLLNPDTIIKKNAIANCYSRLMNSSDAGAGVQLLNIDGSPQISGNYVPPGGINLLMQVPYFGQMLKWAAKRLGAKPTNLPNAVQQVTEVDWINGAFLMVKRTAIEKAGMLDEDFFLYHEESEWCSRLKKTGKLCIYGDLHVIHLEGQSSNKAFGSSTSGHSNLSDKKGYQLMLSMFVRIRKEFGLFWYLVHLAIHTSCIPFVILLSIFQSLIIREKQVFISAVGYSKNLIRCWTFAPKILNNKPYFYKVL